MMGLRAAMTNRFVNVMVLAGCATASGCVVIPHAVSYSAVNAPPRPFVRRAPADVDVFVGKPPARPYVDVGLFEVTQGTTDEGSRTPTESMIKSLRMHAALRGCDAVQILGVELISSYNHHVSHESRMVSGVCEMYTDEQAQLAAVRLASASPPPLPGEGKSCVAPDGPTPEQPPCPDPLVCAHNVCASPYQ